MVLSTTGLYNKLPATMHAITLHKPISLADPTVIAEQGDGTENAISFVLAALDGASAEPAPMNPGIVKYGQCTCTNGDLKCAVVSFGYAHSSICALYLSSLVYMYKQINKYTYIHTYMIMYVHLCVCPICIHICILYSFICLFIRYVIPYVGSVQYSMRSHNGKTGSVPLGLPLSRAA